MHCRISCHDLRRQKQQLQLHLRIPAGATEKVYPHCFLVVHRRKEVVVVDDEDMAGYRQC